MTTNREEAFEEVILASETGTVFIKIEDEGGAVLIGLTGGHDTEGPPPVWVELTSRQLRTLSDMLKEYCDDDTSCFERGS